MAWLQDAIPTGVTLQQVSHGQLSLTIYSGFNKNILNETDLEIKGIMLSYINDFMKDANAKSQPCFAPLGDAECQSVVD